MDDFLNNKHTGWSDYENKLLWETADEAQQQGLPLKSVFQKISECTGRRPNSIRNYYYSQVHEREGGHIARFVPFTQSEIDDLMDKVLRARARGQSVRACLQEISGGDKNLMLRYQNKYRSMLRLRPDYVSEMVEKLNDEGVLCDTPFVSHRVKPTVEGAMEYLNRTIAIHDEEDVARALSGLADYFSKPRFGVETINAIIEIVEKFANKPTEEKQTSIDDFCAELLTMLGNLVDTQIYS